MNADLIDPLITARDDMHAMFENEEWTCGSDMVTALEGARSLIEQADIPVNEVVASGSRGFDVTARQGSVDNVSPGTWTLWDTGYGDVLDFPFEWAAIVVSRVISRADKDLVTLDAGNKAVAPDTVAPHFRILGLDDQPEFLIRNEEHQLLRWPKGHTVR